ncbi:hypothetical protein DSAG12_04430 [Promethearchaeum syntrophicum]|uniref:Uncharacterized protein n=1 Tax=Promethearchaeum syntrophicum TaxID=2594042 RepID=A0AC61ZU28_9ARCH|nr:hypothetical protein [Candidatus Prometheoarchaeum syntrophicum]
MNEYSSTDLNNFHYIVPVSLDKFVIENAFGRNHHLTIGVDQ